MEGNSKENNIKHQWTMEEFMDYLRTLESCRFPKYEELKNIYQKFFVDYFCELPTDVLNEINNSIFNCICLTPIFHDYNTHDKIMDIQISFVNEPDPIDPDGLGFSDIECPYDFTQIEDEANDRLNNLFPGFKIDLSSIPTSISEFKVVFKYQKRIIIELQWDAAQLADYDKGSNYSSSLSTLDKLLYEYFDELEIVLPIDFFKTN